MDDQKAMAELAENLWNNYIKQKYEALQNEQVSFYRTKSTSNNVDGTLSVQSPFDNQRTVNRTVELHNLQPDKELVVLHHGNGNAMMNHLAAMYATPSGLYTLNIKSSSELAEYIVLEVPPDKLLYNGGELIDLTGAVVVAYLADGTPYKNGSYEDSILPLVPGGSVEPVTPDPDHALNTNLPYYPTLNTMVINGYDSVFYMWGYTYYYNSLMSVGTAPWGGTAGYVGLSVPLENGSIMLTRYNDKVYMMLSNDYLGYQYRMGYVEPGVMYGNINAPSVWQWTTSVLYHYEGFGNVPISDNDPLQAVPVDDKQLVTPGEWTEYGTYTIESYVTVRQLVNDFLGTWEAVSYNDPNLFNTFMNQYGDSIGVLFNAPYNNDTSHSSGTLLELSRIIALPTYQIGDEIVLANVSEAVELIFTSNFVENRLSINDLEQSQGSSHVGVGATPLDTEVIMQVRNVSGINAYMAMDQTINLLWPREGDGKILTTSFQIRVKVN